MILYIANIRNTIDREKKPVGHTEKSMKEAISLIDHKYDCGIIGSNEILECFDEKRKITLPFTQQYKQKRNRISSFIKDFLNTQVVLKRIGKTDTAWFIIMSEGVFWGIALSPKGNKRILATMYLDYKDHFLNASRFNSLRRFIFNKACRKIDLAITTNKHFVMPCRYIFLPDYYLSDRVKSIVIGNKKKKVVCLGQMRESRDLDTLIEVFNNTSITLEVIGQFYDKNWYKNLREKASPNIVIQDRKITDEEYYQILAEAEYSIMPYDMRIYKGRTSGVLLDSVFMRCTPIAPKELLDYNSIDGIKYNSLDEVPRMINQGIVIENDLQQFEIEKIQRKLLTELDVILDETNRIEELS